jgi:hypothetical protein
MPCGTQMASHGRAHDPQADKSEFHDFMSLMIC